jgi:hypothetical protein
MGFNQEELIKYDVDMSDVLLLDYIQKALSQPSMIKVTEGEQPYVWLCHSKILEDLPILNIKESMLKKRLANLIDIGLIDSVVLANTSGRGSRTYYTITNKFEELQFTTTGNKLPLNSRPQIKNYTSDSTLNRKPIQKTISKDIVETDTKYSNSKSKKNLYQKCMDMIDEYTTNVVLREKLKECFKLFTENNREVGKPLYANQFKGKLNMLSDLATDSATQIKIVEQTLKLGYNGFYELKEDKPRRRTGNVAHDIEHLYNGVNEKADKRCSDGEKF